MNARSNRQPTFVKAIAAAAITTTLVFGLSACGGSDSGGGSDGGAPGPEHQPKVLSVGEGDAAAPPIAAEVTAAARTAGCTVRAFPSEGPQGLIGARAEPR